jgi:hypothetical protein
VSFGIKKLCEENKLEVTNQHRHSLNTRQVSWRVLPKEKVNQSYVKVIEKSVGFHKWALIRNANYLVENMNKFAKCSINVERDKL